MDSIKCPFCSGQGYKYQAETRWYFRCTECGLETLLKLLASLSEA